MNERLNPFSASPGAMQELMSLQEYLHAAGFDPAMMGLVRTRVSQINGCTHGIGLHTRRALTLGESDERLTLTVAATNAWNRVGVSFRGVTS